MAGVGQFLGGFGGGVYGSPAPGSQADVRSRLQQAGQAGIFDPFGSPRLRQLLRQRALQLSQARGQQASGASTLYGLDPMQRRAAMAGANIGAAGDTANALNNAEYGLSTANQGQLWNLLNNQQNFYQQQALMRQMQQQQGQGAFGQILGTVGGQALGGWLSPGGWFGHK